MTFDIASAILVSSNPTNLVLSGAFQLSFVKYTLNMIIPVIVTAAVLFPFLLYIIFPSTDLIPYRIDLHTLRDEPQPVNVQGVAMSREEELRLEQSQQREEELREIMDPFLDQKGAFFGGFLLMICLTTLLATNAAGLHPGVWTMTVPAGAIMFFRDLIYDWTNRRRTREMARKKRIERAQKMYRRRLEREREREERARAAAAALVPPENLTQSPTEMTEAERIAGERERDVLRFQAVEDEKAAVQRIENHLYMNPHPLGRDVSHDSFQMIDELVAPEPSHPSGMARDLETGMSSTAFRDAPSATHRPHRPHGHRRTQTKDTVGTMETITSIPLASSPEQLRRSMSNGTIEESPLPPPLIPPTPTRRPRDLPPIDTSDAEYSPPSHPTSAPVSEVSSIASASGPEINPHEPKTYEKSENGELGNANPAGEYKPRRRSLYGAWRGVRRYAKETFPTVCAVIEHLPFALLPFAFSMFILVQGLVTKGWVEAFANGWNAWVTKTGTVGAIGGMGFVSVLLCNVCLRPISCFRLICNSALSSLQGPISVPQFSSHACFSVGSTIIT